VVAVTITGLAVRAPLARVPENTMNFAVGIMLTSFGSFWGAEGAGVHWSGGDAALLGVLAYVLVVSLLAVRVLRQIGQPRSVASRGTDPTAPTSEPTVAG
jgi:uncharacterized membrane protein